MKKLFLVLITLLALNQMSFAQGKTIIGILPFKSGGQSNNNYNNRRSQEEGKNVTAIQDAVTDAFLRTKRFSLVEREKMDQIKSEKNLQKNEDFIDGTVIEQSKSLGAQYIVLGNVSDAELKQTSSYAPFAGQISSQSCDLNFNIKVVDVSTGEIMASNSFSGSAKGKKAFEQAMDQIRPDLEKFIKENFKVTLSVASIEEKGDKGAATKILIAGGSSVGMKEGNEIKIYEASELMVDGKKLTRKITIGTAVVTKVEDENFSVCKVMDGGDAIAKKMEASAKIKCEVTKE